MKCYKGLFFLFLVQGCSSSNSPGGSSTSNDKTVKQIAIGLFHKCAVVGETARCWGLNGSGQLGNNSTTRSSKPVQVEGLTSGVTFIAAGGSTSCAIVSGAAKCWGANTYGQLGNNSTTNSSVPVQVEGLTSGVSAIAIGAYHGCAVVSGAVKCWGANTAGKLGDGTTTDSLLPVSVSGISSGATHVIVNTDVSCALINGAVKCWGFNYYGELGDNNKPNSSYTPVQVSGLTVGVNALSASGDSFSVCADLQGYPYCWGRNNKGQLGDGTTTDSAVPVAVSGLVGSFGGISMGISHACDGDTNGKVYCWGSNEYGELGDGTTTSSSTPVVVKGLSGVPISGATGNIESCTVIKGGTLQCWGSGHSSGPATIEF